MHSAPSVSYPVGRSRNADLLLLASWLIGVAAVGVACAQSAAPGWREGVLVLCAIVAAGAAWTARLRPAGAANLVFDGQHWSISGNADVPMGRAGVMLDLQALLLVRFVAPTGRACWLWAERRSLPPRWLDLRRALYSRPSPAEAVAQPPDSTSANVQHLPP